MKIRPIQDSDETPWRALWQSYLRFYKVELDRAVTDATWQRIVAGRDGFSAFVVVMDPTDRPHSDGSEGDGRESDGPHGDKADNDKAEIDRGESEKGEVVGFAICLLHPSTWSTRLTCYLEDLYVDEAARSKGAGRALIETIYKFAEALDCHRVYWHTDETNETARRLYDQVGYYAHHVQYRRPGD